MSEQKPKIRYHKWTKYGHKCQICGQGRPAKRSWIFKNSKKRAMGECPGPEGEGS